MSAEQGNPSSQFTLGSMYVEGHGVPQNSKKGIKLLKKAAEFLGLSMPSSSSACPITKVSAYRRTLKRQRFGIALRRIRATPKRSIGLGTCIPR